MPTTALYKKLPNNPDPLFNGTRAKVFYTLTQLLPPEFGETSAAYQARIDEEMLNLGMADNEMAMQTLQHLTGEMEKQLVLKSQRNMDKIYAKHPDGRFITAADGTTLVRKQSKRQPIRFTSAQVHMMLTLHKQGYSYAAIAKGMREHLKLPAITDAAVRMRIKLGMPKKKVMLRVSNELMVNTLTESERQVLNDD